MESYHISILGDGGVGKTALIRALNGEPIRSNYLATYSPIVGYQKVVETARGPITLKFYDYPGQEKYGNKPMRQSDLALILYDVSNRVSYKNALDYWKRFAGTTPVLFIGNKSDVAEHSVESEHRKISCNRPETIQALIGNILERLEVQ